MAYWVIAQRKKSKKEFFLNIRDCLSYAFLKYLSEGPKTPQMMTYQTASSKEKAMKLASEMLASGHYEYVQIHNPQEPEIGVIVLRPEKKAKPK